MLPLGNFRIRRTAVNSSQRSPDGPKMEWIGPFFIGAVIIGGLIQLLWSYAISTIALKTDQSELMEVLAWIPLLQIAPMIEAGGGSVGRFLIGSLGVIVGSATLIVAAQSIGGSLGQLMAGFGLGLTTLFIIFYFGRMASATAAARHLPGWVGLLIFVPPLSFFVHPYIAFHDGWISPNKLGLTIGLILVLGGMVSPIRTLQSMNESGILSPGFLESMSESELTEFVESGGFPMGMQGFSPNRLSDESREVLPRSTSSDLDTEAIRALYDLKELFDTLDTLTTPKNLMIDNQRVLALGIIHSIRADLEARREALDPSAYDDLADHLLEIEAMLHGQSRFELVALDSSGKTKVASFSNATIPPSKPFLVHASNDCPAGTETRVKKDEQGEQEWCQQLAADGGLRHGWYARYDNDGRPESMGQYQNGLRMGVWTRFYSSGEVRAQAEFRDGLQHGWLLAFDRTGKRTRSTRFEDGAPVSVN